MQLAEASSNQPLISASLSDRKADTILTGRVYKVASLNSLANYWFTSALSENLPLDAVACVDPIVQPLALENSARLLRSRIYRTSPADCFAANHLFAFTPFLKKNIGFQCLQTIEWIISIKIIRNCFTFIIEKLSLLFE